MRFEVTKEITRPRGRPRRFDLDGALAEAQRLFHARGYDAVSVADLTTALGINPPSFYAAFGSKAGLFQRVLHRYAQHGAIGFDEHLSADRSVAQGLAELLEAAARTYAADPSTTGCLVLEGSRCNDPGARQASAAVNAVAEEAIRRYVAARHPDLAEALTDYVVTVMSGLSTRSRCGQSLDRLLSVARLAGGAVAQAVSAPEKLPFKSPAPRRI